MHAYSFMSNTLRPHDCCWPGSSVHAILQARMRERVATSYSKDYSVEMTNRFKGLDLVDKVPEELWTEVHDIVQEAVIKTIPKKKKCKMAKWLSEEALQIVEKEEKLKAKENTKDIPI